MEVSIPSMWDFFDPSLWCQDPGDPEGRVYALKNPDGTCPPPPGSGGQAPGSGGQAPGSPSGPAPDPRSGLRMTPLMWAGIGILAAIVFSGFREG
jgi:hypothetical protein